MGLLWRLLAPKPLKQARRAVRKAAHPVHTATRAVTPKPVKQLQRAAHPVRLAELTIEDAAVNALRGKPRQKKSRRTLLVAEDAGPYDANAVAIWIKGLKVGHLSRADARRYRPGLLRLQEFHGQPIALEGVIVGGGIREDGPGRLGVFLRHDPEDFGL